MDNRSEWIGGKKLVQRVTGNRIGSGQVGRFIGPIRPIGPIPPMTTDFPRQDRDF